MSSIYHELTDQELHKRNEESRSELRELRFAYAMTRSLQNPSRVRTLKRDVARIETVLSERNKGISTVKPATSRKKK